MSKDKILGIVIFALCTVIAVIYVVTLAYPNWLSNFGMGATTASIQFWIVAIPVAIGFVGILVIGAWIGWTMATTPAPKPTEAIENDPDQKPATP